MPARVLRVAPPRRALPVSAHAVVVVAGNPTGIRQPVTAGQSALLGKLQGTQAIRTPGLTPGR